MPTPAGWPSFIQIGSLPGSALAEHAVDYPKPLATVRPFCQSFCLQRIPQLCVGADNAECNVTRREFNMEIERHTRPRQIDVGDAERSQTINPTSDDFLNAVRTASWRDDPSKA